MLTPVYIRLSFACYWIVGLALAYTALFFNVTKHEFSTQFTIAFSISAVTFFILGYMALKKWFVYEDIAQRSASILMQTNKQPADVVHSELKSSLASDEFMHALSRGIESSKWCIHNDTTLKNAELRVEIDLPEEWYETPKLWCATGLIAGSLPPEYHWGSTGRQRTKIVLTVKSPSGTTVQARSMAVEWINVPKTTLCKPLGIDNISEAYTKAEVPNSVLNSELLILNPPPGKWSVLSKLATNNIVLKIGKEEDTPEYYVCISDEHNSRTDYYKDWKTIVSTWASFPEVKTAIIEKFKLLKTS